MKRTPRACTAFTLVELLVLVAIIGVLLGLLLPATRSSGDAARRMSCSNNFKQIGLAIHNYHSTFHQLPMQMGGTFAVSSDSDGTGPAGNNRYRLSYLVAVLPFLEYQRTWTQISNGSNDDSQRYPPMGPAPWTRQFDPWEMELPTLRCPSDPGLGLPAHGRSNYAACLGDATHWMNTGPIRFDLSKQQWVSDRTKQIAVSGRGMFVPRMRLALRDVRDGLSNTLMAGEISTDFGDLDSRTHPTLHATWRSIHDRTLDCRSQTSPERPRFWSKDAEIYASFDDQRRGFRWADGAALYTGFNTTVPPNSPVCMAGGDAGVGSTGTSSRHYGGAHVLMGDGAVIFLTDSIDCGDQNSPTVRLKSGQNVDLPPESPYGMWGALSTRAANEEIEEQLNQ